jgi:pSer/pThr/pTyr-binding forkhead associated (FHA) protein
MDKPTDDGQCRITLHLLDGGNGETVQTWHFEERTRIVIGRSHEADVTVNDRFVSRTHAEIVQQGAGWQLVAVGRNGIVVDNERVETFALSDGVTFQLGANGPAFRFHDKYDDADSFATLSFDSGSMLLLMLDEEQKAREVQSIADTPYFQQLKEVAAELKRRRST